MREVQLSMEVQTHGHLDSNSKGTVSFRQHRMKIQIFTTGQKYMFSIVMELNIKDIDKAQSSTREVTFTSEVREIHLNNSIISIKPMTSITKTRL